MAVPQFDVPAKPPRPGIVTAAGYLQFAVVAWVFAMAIVGFFVTRSISDELVAAVLKDDNTLTQDQAQQVTDFVMLAAGIGVFCALILPGTVAILGIWTLKGVNGVRIATWVVAGIGVLCGLFGLLSTGLNTASTSFSGGTAQEKQLAAQLDLEKLMPSWYQPLEIVSGVVTTGMYAAIVVLLLLPKAHDFFRTIPRPPAQAVFVPYGQQYPQPPVMPTGMRPYEIDEPATPAPPPAGSQDDSGYRRPDQPPYQP